MPSYSGVWNLVSQYQAKAQGNWPVPPPTGDLAVFAGGYTGAFVNTIDYMSVSSLGNAQDFGDLSSGLYVLAACSSSTRGLFASGYNASVGYTNNEIQYITFATTGNTSDFGDLSVGRSQPTGLSNSTRGVFAGGNNYPTMLNIIDYVTIASTGNATDFGDMITNGYSLVSANSTTRGVIMGGFDGSRTNVIQYITIASTGNATDFGDMTPGTRSGGNSGVVCSSTRGLFMGGVLVNNVTNTIDYITIASTGDSVDFGDLTVAKDSNGGGCNATRGVSAGGDSVTNVMEYVTIASTGNATDFGDLTQARYGLAGCSNAHGGL